MEDVVGSPLIGAEQVHSFKAKMLGEQWMRLHSMNLQIFKRKLPNAEQAVVDLKAQLVSAGAEISALKQLLVRKNIITEEEYLEQCVEEMKFFSDTLARS